MSAGDHDYIIWTSFEPIQYSDTKDSINTHPTPRLCLIVGYANGWAVWDVTNPTQMKVLTSKRECGVKSAHFFAKPANEPGLPHMAIISNGDTTDFPPQQAHRSTHAMPFERDVDMMTFHSRVSV